ncbi:MAG: protein kinase [Polyangiaceae bacterium]
MRLDFAEHVVLEGRFRLERPAGEGGSARVYRATDLLTGEPVAVKIVAHRSGEQAARFAREAATIALLSHPAIVRYVAHGRGPDPSNAFLAMEWIEGPSLRDRLLEGPMSVAETVACAHGIAIALSAAHAAGIVHRDIKPGNVMLAGGAAARVKLVDFGVARAPARAGEITIAGSVVGTVGYMAPEQARGEAQLTPAADVYALGCVIYRCLAGRLPFPGDELLTVLVQLVLEDPPRLSSVRAEVPEWLDDLVASMLSREPEYRPASAAAVAQAIERHMAHEGAGDSTRAKFSESGAPLQSALTASERRIGCAVLGAATAAGFVPVYSAQDRRALSDAARPFGAEVHVLADGSVLATIPAEGRATDRAARAARTALALRELLVGIPVCILVGEHADPRRVAEGVGSYLPVLRSDSTFAIRLDDTAAGLLDARFDIAGDALGLFLRGERDAADVGRTLLGRSTPFLGRDRDLAILVSLFQEVTSEGVARAAVVTGDAGIGKSRLRREVLRRALEEVPHAQVWIGVADPLAVGSPFALAGQALRRTAGIAPLDAPDIARRKLRARAGRSVPASLAQGVAELLGEVCGVPFDDATSAPLRAARRDPALMADQTLLAFDRFVQAECEAAPLIIVLDDLQWGDLPTVRLIDAALRGERPLLVLSFARPEVHARFPDLFHRRTVTHLRLGALPPRSSERLTREVLGAAADPALVARIVALSAGNAFYLEELIRAAAQGRTEALPETVLAMAQSVFDTLDPASRRALRASSVFGAEIPADGLGALLGVAAGEARALLDPLVASELLTRDLAPGSGAERYAFRHAMLREAAYAMLDDADRELGHRLAGELLASSGERDAMRLGEHFERGRRPKIAAVHYLRAAEQALAGNDLVEAIARARRGLTCGAEGATMGALHLVQAEAERWRGRNAEGRVHAEAALANLPPGSASWCTAASELASCALKLLAPETIDELGAALLLRAAEDAPSSALVIACARVAAAALLSRRTSTFRCLLDVLESPGTDEVSSAPEVRARVCETRAIAALLRGDPCAFLAGSEAATAAFLEVGDLRSATIQRANQGHVYSGLGAHEEAERALRDVLSTPEPLASPQVLCAAQQNLGNMLLAVGRLDEARALLADSLAAAVAQGDRRLEVGARVYLSHCARAAGDLEGALAHVAGVTAPRGLPTLHVQALAARAAALLAGDRVTEALETALLARTALDDLGGTLEEGESRVRLAIVEALLAAGRRDEGALALTAATRSIDERAARITSDALRRAFLSRVPENARLFELFTTSRETATLEVR